MASRSFLVRIPPVGFCGELRMTSFVFFVIFDSSSAGSKAKLREDDELCFFRDLRFELGRIEGEIARLAQMQRHRHRAVCDDLRLVDRKSGIRIDHLVADAVVGGGKDGVRDEGFGPSAYHHVLGPDREAPHLAHVARGRLAQLDDAGRGRVAVPAFAHRPHGRILDVRGRVEIRLPDAKRDDVLALADELVHLGEDDEGVLGAEVRGAAADAGHGRTGQADARDAILAYAAAPSCPIIRRMRRLGC